MNAFEELQNLVDSHALALWIIIFAATSMAIGISRGFFKARKIQPNRFRWEIFRKEIFFSIINISLSTTIIVTITAALTKNGFITYRESPASWEVIAFEFVIYFLAFDAYFYWLHRWMHRKSVYKWVHKIHHYSVTPNPLTTLSFNPIESYLSDGFVPLFLAAFTVHSETLAFIAPCNTVLGLYAHLGYELLPRWWNKNWATKWFFTTSITNTSTAITVHLRQSGTGYAERFARVTQPILKN